MEPGGGGSLQWRDRSPKEIISRTPIKSQLYISVNRYEVVYNCERKILYFMKGLDNLD